MPKKIVFGWRYNHITRKFIVFRKRHSKESVRLVIPVSFEVKTWEKQSERVCWDMGNRFTYFQKSIGFDETPFIEMFNKILPTLKY